MINQDCRCPGCGECSASMQKRRATKKSDNKEQLQNGSQHQKATCKGKSMILLNLTTILGETHTPVVVIAEHIRMMRGLTATNRQGTFLYLGDSNPLMVEETVAQIKEQIKQIQTNSDEQAERAYLEYWSGSRQA